MGIVERKKRERTERKSLIMGCAKELILQYGAEEVSMMDIARQAELSKATLYLYFPSKDMLINEICGATANQFIEYFRSRLEANLEAIDVLKLFWACYLDLFGESEDMIILFSMRRYLAPNYPFLSIHEKEDSSITYEFYTILKDTIGRGIAEGSFDSNTDPGAVSQAIFSLFSGMIADAATLPKQDRNPRLIMEEMRKLFQIILNGITREGVSRSRLILPDSNSKYKKNEEKNA
jgi:AcrR family transcriptional regulator